MALGGLEGKLAQEVGHSVLIRCERANAGAAVQRVRIGPQIGPGRRADKGGGRSGRLPGSVPTARGTAEAARTGFVRRSRPHEHGETAHLVRVVFGGDEGAVGERGRLLFRSPQLAGRAQRGQAAARRRRREMLGVCPCICAGACFRGERLRAWRRREAITLARSRADGRTRATPPSAGSASTSMPLPPAAIP